ncbi:MAG: CsgG/HfaB family protein [Candidatus Krumholzibacteria bacterium]|nr:CsgG/HfaB family protein [Candidatus Krumholzibacteria bacterium]
MKASMSMRLSVIILAMALVVVLAPRPASADEMGLKFRVVVGSFENKADAGWYHGPEPGDGMADMLITALMKTGKFRVYERDALAEILAEKNLSMSDLAKPGVTAAQKLEIGDILVKAAITEFGYKESKAGGALSKVSKSASLGSYTGRVAVDLRLIDVGSGEVLWADSVDKSETSRSIGLATESFSFGDQKSFDEHVVGKATRKVIDGVVEKLEEQVAKRPWQGLLIAADEFLFIDGGTELGIKNGMVFEVKRQTQEVKHPKTGKVLKVLHETVGEVKAVEVEDGVTTVQRISGSGFQTGDVVMIKK